MNKCCADSNEWSWEIYISSPRSLTPSGPLHVANDERKKGRVRSRSADQKEEKRKRTISSSFGTIRRTHSIKSSDSAPDNTRGAADADAWWAVQWALYQSARLLECLRAKCACDCPLESRPSVALWRAGRTSEKSCLLLTQGLNNIRIRTGLSQGN